jgi:hypothetical protein
MMENRSFDHTLGLINANQGNRPSSGQAFEGLSGNATDRDGEGNAVPGFGIAPTEQKRVLQAGAAPGEGYVATNLQLFGSAAVSPGRHTDNGRLPAGFCTNASPRGKLALFEPAEHGRAKHHGRTQAGNASRPIRPRPRLCDL